MIAPPRSWYDLGVAQSGVGDLGYNPVISSAVEEWRRGDDSDIDGRAEGRVSGSE